MIRFLLPIIFLTEAFCIYHAVKNDKDMKWFFLILLFPFIGSMIYMYVNMLYEPTIDDIAETVKETIEPDYKTEKLEKAAEFSGTFNNKIRLGDEYIQKERYDDAIQVYESCLVGMNSDSPEVFLKLLKVHYLKEEYTEAVKYGKKLETEKHFEKTDEKIAYAWALHYTGNSDEAEVAFKSMDGYFSNYKHRYEYALFLKGQNRNEDALSLTKELLDEFSQMDRNEQRMKKEVFKAIKDLEKEL